MEYVGIAIGIMIGAIMTLCVWAISDCMINRNSYDKKLLLKDLYPRLPYNVIVNDGNEIDTLKAYMLDDLMFIDEAIIRPYLRPFSNMTEEEKEEYDKTFDWDYSIPGTPFDWLNAHHFDYRGLIEKGLALEAPEGMYKTE